MNDADRTQAERHLIRSILNTPDADEAEPPPAWLAIRLDAPLGDDAPDDATQDDG